MNYPSPKSDSASSEHEDYRNANFLNKLFILVASSSIGAGILIALVIFPLRFFAPLAIVPSFLWGFGVGTFVYRFMGGFNQEDSVNIGLVKLGGSLASLIAATVAFNQILSPQIDRYVAEHLYPRKESNGEIAIEIENQSNPPEEQAKNYRLGTIDPPELNRINYHDINEVSVVVALEKLASTKGYNHPVLEKIRQECSRNQGICAPEKNEFNLVVHSIDPTLAEGQAKGCLNSDDFWIRGGSRGLVIYKNTDRVAQVKIQEFSGCLDDEGKNKKIIVSQTDAKDLFLKSQETIQARFQ